MNQISLKLSCVQSFLPVVLSFAEETSKVFGLGESESFAMRLSSEEIFSYLAQLLENQELEIICKNKGFCVELEFLFKGNISLRAFNLTTNLSPDNSSDLDEIGLLIASRLMDNFSIIREKDRTFKLTLIKDKVYPEIKDDSKVIFQDSNDFTIKTPEKEEIKIFSKKVFLFYKDKLFPDFFKYPGKIVDMVNYGNYKILVAIDDKNQIVGGILWHRLTTKLIEFFGPYEFKKDFNKSVKENLIISFLENIGKSEAIAVFSKLSYDELPLEYFEIIGEIPFFNNNVPVYFRQLKEDPGAISWCSESLKSFLENQYNKLFLPRRIEIINNMGEKIPEYSVIAVNFHKSQKIAILNLIMLGKDIQENIKNHVNLLKKENYENIIFEIDLGLPEQAYIIDSLFKNNFSPKVLIPSGGTGDIVLFIYSV